MQVIVKPILSEKMTALTDKQNRVAFVVSKAANKLEIKRAVEAMYSVTVKSVNTMVYQGDAKSRYTKAGVISGPFGRNSSLYSGCRRGKAHRNADRRGALSTTGGAACRAAGSAAGQL